MIIHVARPLAGQRVDDPVAGPMMKVGVGIQPGDLADLRAGRVLCIDDVMADLGGTHLVLLHGHNRDAVKKKYNVFLTDHAHLTVAQAERDRAAAALDGEQHATVLHLARRLYLLATLGPNQQPVYVLGLDDVSLACLRKRQHLQFRARRVEGAVTSLEVYLYAVRCEEDAARTFSRHAGLTLHRRSRPDPRRGRPSLDPSRN